MGAYPLVGRDVLRTLSEIDYQSAMITFCKRFDQSSPIWNLSRHSHTFIELIFFLRGEATIALGDEVLSPASYDMIVYYPNHEHQEAIDLTKSQEIICVWVDIGELPPHGDGAFRLRDKNRVFEWLFIHLEKEYRKNDPFSQKLITCYLDAIFQNMLRQLTEDELTGTLNTVEKAKSYMNEHFTRSISLTRLSEQCHVSASYLHRVFQKQVGVTPIQYITKLRIREALYLLESSSLLIVDIAEHCGFTDSRYFSRVFKKQMGYTPSQYRDQLASINETPQP